MAIDDLVVRKEIWIKTFRILQEHNINMYYIIDEFQDRYKVYNIKNYNVPTLATHPNREELLIKREYDVAIEILKENKIINPERYFNN